MPENATKAKAIQSRSPACLANTAIAFTMCRINLAPVMSALSKKLAMEQTQLPPKLNTGGPPQQAQTTFPAHIQKHVLVEMNLLRLVNVSRVTVEYFVQIVLDDLDVQTNSSVLSAKVHLLSMS